MPKEGLFPNIPASNFLSGSQPVRRELMNLSRRRDIIVPSIDLQSIRGNPRALIEAYELDLKPARNTLTALFLEEIADEVTAERKANPPFGLNTSGDWLGGTVTQITDFNTQVTDGMLHTWERAIQKWYDPLQEWVKTIPEDQLLTLNPTEYPFRERMFAKYWYTTYVMRTAIRQALIGDDTAEGAGPDSFIHHGVVTGALFATKATRLGGEVYARDLYDSDFAMQENVKEMSDVDAIYPLTAWLAKLSKVHGTNMIQALEGSESDIVTPEMKAASINPDDYEYKIIHGKKILVPKFNLTQITTPDGEVIFDIVEDAPRTGCPAIGAETENFSDNANLVSIIKYQLQWASDIARQTIFPQIADAAAKK